MPKLDFDCAVFGVNEAATIGACVAAIDRACVGHAARISVLLNGTTDDSARRLAALEPASAALSVYRFPIRDKANAINHFLYHLRRPAKVLVCIDAYAMISAGTLRALARALAEHPDAAIASSVPLAGRSAGAVTRQTLRGGVVSGQCFALRPAFVDRLVAKRLRLPLEIYRGDPLLGSMAAHDLDAMNHQWDDRRIVGVADATFTFRPLSPFRWHDWQRQYRREVRQVRGRLENAAIKSIIYARGYAALPENASDMIRDWLQANPAVPQSLRERCFLSQALAQLDAPRLRAVDPDLLFEHPGPGATPRGR